MRLILALSFLGISLSPMAIKQSAAKEETVASPDGNLVIKVSDDQAHPQYSVFFRDKLVIQPSALGLIFKQQPAFTHGFKISRVETASQDQQWQQPWGERRLVQDRHNELVLTLRNDHLPKVDDKPGLLSRLFTDSDAIQTGEFRVRFRVFDDGLGFRYEVPKQSGYEQVEIVKETTEFTINQADGATAWWIPARGWNRYEYTYKQTPLFDASHVHTPFTFKMASGVHLSIHEAALVDYAAMTLNQRRPGRFIADLTPWYDGVAVKTQTDFKSPWRTIQVSADAKGLLNSDLILNLNEPNKLGDVSWVKPGKYVGIWWEMHVNKSTWGSGERHGATTENTKRFIDFAAKYGFDGVLVEGWNTGGRRLVL